MTFTCTHCHKSIPPRNHPAIDLPAEGAISVSCASCWHQYWIGPQGQIWAQEPTAAQVAMGGPA